MKKLPIIKLKIKNNSKNKGQLNQCPFEAMRIIRQIRDELRTTALP